MAVGYLTDAEAYTKAAVELNRLDRKGMTSPTYFLLCHAMELLFKAYILASGGDAKGLRKQAVQHNLSELHKRAQQLNLPTDDKAEAVVKMLAPYHQNHSFRYRDPGYKTFPATEVVLEVLHSLTPPISILVRKALRDNFSEPSGLG
jgi:hypothetical protein